ncbi:MAG: hypothetical protein H0T79_13455 [Deltaproteobacteria bacterium]|nr:hypothetical protein [Deltaproteobacteria bacterium]
MMLSLLPLVSLAIATSPGSTVAADKVMSPRIAQVRLAETLASADSIDWVRANGKTITFAIDRNGEAYRVVATTGARGTVIGFAITDVGTATGEAGNLVWLANELANTVAVTRLIADEDGAVTITTSDGSRYMAIPGRGSGGNMGVEARWAAAWNTTDA